MNNKPKKKNFNTLKYKSKLFYKLSFKIYVFYFFRNVQRKRNIVYINIYVEVVLLVFKVIISRTI